MPLRYWYNCGTNHFHQADFYLAYMKKLTILSNKSCTAWSCAENQIFVVFLRIKSSEQEFKYLYLTISKIFLWNLLTWKGIYTWLIGSGKHLYVRKYVAHTSYRSYIFVYTSYRPLVHRTKGSFAKETYVLM